MSAESWFLQQVAHGRSGDKGNHANVAIIAYTEVGYAWLKRRLTSQIVFDYFAPLGLTRVERFEADNVLALNFLLHNVLAGGASQSLRSDNQGKTLALALLNLSFEERPDQFQSMLRPSQKG